MASDHGRSKRSYVCDQCYRCKVKCSKEQPSCRRCQQAGRACTYSLGLWKGQPRHSNQKNADTINDIQSKLTPPMSTIDDGEGKN